MFHRIPLEEEDYRAWTYPEDLTLSPGHWRRADARNEDNEKITDIWEVSDSSILKLRFGFWPDGAPLGGSDDISIEALAPGEATLTVRDGESEASVKVIVESPLPLIHVRSRTDRPDDVDGPQIHAVYAVASDGVDYNLDRSGRIGWSLSSTVDWLDDKLGRRLRVDTYNGEVDVTYIRLPETVAEMEDRNVGAIRNVISAQSWFSPEKTYAIYYSGPTDDAGGVKTGAFAAVFSDSRGVDRGHYFVTREPGFLGSLENTMAHELFHTMGGVDETCAMNPAADGSSHVGDDETDLMAIYRKRGRMLTQIDVGRDDYYEHDIPGCADVAYAPLWIDPPAGEKPLPLQLRVYDFPIPDNPEELTFSAGESKRAAMIVGSKVVAAWEVSDPSIVRIRVGVWPDGTPLRSPDDISIEALAPGEATLTVRYGWYDESTIRISVVE